MPGLSDDMFYSLFNSGPFERHLTPRTGAAAGADVGRGFDKLAQRLTQLQGVLEVTVVVAEQRLYLKVGQQHFDLAEAQSLVENSQKS